MNRKETLAEQLDAVAQVTPEDIAAAQEFARQYFTPLMNRLLNAEAEATWIGAKRRDGDQQESVAQPNCNDEN